MESQFIAWLRDRLPAHRALTVGPGDDAAVVDFAGRPDVHGHGVVVTTDMLMDGVDFRIAEVDARLVGRKALAVNLSDLAAMAAVPVAVVVSLALPKLGGLELAKQLYEGLIPLAEQFDTAIAGGDTNTYDGPLVISVTAFGTLTDRGPFLRSGAKAGDVLLVTGDFGGSILGKHFTFVPRVNEAIALRRFDVHAAMDVSDGLSLDLSRLCAASGCGAELRLKQIPVAAAAYELARLQNDGRSALDHALSDGEDFELLLAVPPDEAARLCAEQPLAGVKLTQIGRFVAEPGLWSVDDPGIRTPLVPRGYEH